MCDCGKLLVVVLMDRYWWATWCLCVGVFLIVVDFVVCLIGIRC